jgi:hypothetical protein
MILCHNLCARLISYEPAHNRRIKNDMNDHETHEKARKCSSGGCSVALPFSCPFAVVHADYAQRGSQIMVSVFADHLVIQNPGMMPFGQKG